MAVHAEANAIIWARTDLTGATIYVTCQPCPDCTKLIAGSAIGCVVYLDADGTKIGTRSGQMLS